MPKLKIDNGIFHNQFYLFHYNMSPYALASSASSEHGRKTFVNSTFAAVKSNPFGALAEPSLVQNSSSLSY